MSWRSQGGDAEGGIAGGERNPSHCGGGGVWEASLRNFSKFGCFLLQSRHSSFLFRGLLTQDSFDWQRLTKDPTHRVLGLTDYSDKNAICCSGDSVDGHPESPVPDSGLERNTYRVRDLVVFLMLSLVRARKFLGQSKDFPHLVRAMIGSHPCRTSTSRLSTAAYME